MIEKCIYVAIVSCITVNFLLSKWQTSRKFMEQLKLIRPNIY